MRGYYEKQWQDALAGASIQPSDKLWPNIEKSMSNNNGNRMWLTILLIAATVTLAFAFPLTIGNSSFEARPETYQNLSQVEVKDFESTNLDKSNITSSAAINDNKAIHNITGSTNNTELKQINPNNTLASNKKANSLILDNAQSEIMTANSEAYGLSAVDLGINEPTNLIDSYYLIPYYISSVKIKRDLLASLNMGTGSASAGSGVSGFSAFENADMMAAAEPIAELANSVDRSEANGSTYYFGAGVELPVGNRWSLLTGLGYLTQTATGTSNIVLDNGSSYQPVGAFDPVLPGTVFLGKSYDYTVKNSYINIPLTLKYSVIDKKFKLRAGFGVSTDFMLSHNLNSEAYGSATYTPSSMDYKPIVLAGIINLDLSYSLNNRYSVALETGVRKGLTAIDESKEYYPSSFTVGLILFYKIQR